MVVVSGVLASRNGGRTSELDRLPLHSASIVPFVFSPLCSSPEFPHQGHGSCIFLCARVWMCGGSEVWAWMSR